jgi:hypothetical protein
MKTATKEQRIQVERTVLAFNFNHLVGTPVVVTRDNGQQLETQTRSEAFVSAAGDAVIWVDGIPGYYLLDRVKAAAPTTE